MPMVAAADRSYPKLLSAMNVWDVISTHIVTEVKDTDPRCGRHSTAA